MGCSDERERAKIEKGKRERDQERMHAEGILGEMWHILCTHTIISWNVAPQPSLRVTL